MSGLDVADFVGYCHLCGEKSGLPICGNCLAAWNESLPARRRANMSNAPVVVHLRCRVHNADYYTRDQCWKSRYHPWVTDACDYYRALIQDGEDDQTDKREEPQ